MSLGTFNVNTYCECGASMKANGTGRLDTVETLRDLWRQIHTGEGHGPTDAKTATNARRRNARKYDYEGDQ